VRAQRSARRQGHKGWTSHGRAGGQLPSTARLAYENAYVHALRPVFLVAAGISAVGFVLSLRLRERPLRATASPSQGLDDALAAPKSPSSLAELDRALSVLVSAERRRSFNRRVAPRAGIDLSAGAIWALARFGRYGIEGTREMAREQSDRRPTRRRGAARTARP
jgi:hypothetical protein